MSKASDEVKRKRAIQGGLSITGATLGLAALGTKGGAMALRKYPSVSRFNPKKLERASLGLVTAGAGVGGLSGYHFAALQRAENKAERQREKRVNKMLEYSPFGVVSKAKWDDDSTAKTAQYAGYGGAAAGVGGAVAARDIRDAVTGYQTRKLRPRLGKQKKKMLSAEKKGLAAQEKSAESLRSVGAHHIPGENKYDAKAAKQTKRFFGAEGKAMKLTKKIKNIKANNVSLTPKIRVAALGAGGAALVGSEIARQHRVQKNDWWSDSN